MDTRVYFYKPDARPYGCFSQWAISPFTDIIEGKTCQFHSAEQYMMYHKAVIFNDLGIANKILYQTGFSPWDARALGRRVSRFEPDVWNKHVADIVYRGNFLKFGSNVDMRQTLLSTGDKVLVETSPVDKVWGIGYAEGDAEANIDKWGQNKLGSILMSVRQWYAKDNEFRTRLNVYTDGSCISNGSSKARCGFGICYDYMDVKVRDSVTLEYGRQTNNRAELCAILYALCTIDGRRDVLIHTDSRYSIDCITVYPEMWNRNGWKTARGTSVESVDIIKYILSLVESRKAKGSTTDFVYVKAHAGDRLNETADALAKDGATYLKATPKYIMLRMHGVPF